MKPRVVKEEMPQPKQFIAGEDILNEILGYLGKQPYVEVAGIIQRMSLIKEVPTLTPTPPKEE
jgi:hypothetical protein